MASLRHHQHRYAGGRGRGGRIDDASRDHGARRRCPGGPCQPRARSGRDRLARRSTRSQPVGSGGRRDALQCAGSRGTARQVPGDLGRAVRRRRRERQPAMGVVTRTACGSVAASGREHLGGAAVHRGQRPAPRPDPIALRHCAHPRRWEPVLVAEAARRLRGGRRGRRRPAHTHQLDREGAARQGGGVRRSGADDRGLR